MESRRRAFLLFPDTGNPIEAEFINFLLIASNKSVALAIEGKFIIEFNGNRVNYKGKLKLYSSR